MIDGMDFSDALQALKKGRRVQRLGWNGSGMYLCLVDGSQFTVNRAPLNKHLEEGVVVNYHAHIDIYTAQGYLVPWVASQTDLLADDWQTLNDGEGHG